MKSFVPSLFKFILGMFLFGLAFWAKPIEGYCASSDIALFPLTNVTTPSYVNSSSSSTNLAINDYLLQYGLVPYSSFDVSFSLSFVYSGNGSLSDVSLLGFANFDIDLLFSGADGAAYSKPLLQSSYSYGFSSSSSDNSYNIVIHSFCEGIPTGIRIKVLNGDNRSFSIVNNYINGVSSTVEQSFSYDILASCVCDFINFSFEEGSSSGTSTIINNISSNLVPIGYSSLNFGLNGNIYFLGASRIFEPSYLSPLYFDYDFASSLSGTVYSAPLTLAMGGYDSGPNIDHASPISVIGDTRKGEYELSIGLCLNYTPSPAQLETLTTLSSWGFEFNRGYSGQQFPMPSDARISYTNFIDNKTGYCFLTIYFYFSTPDFFDSFLIRTAPSLNYIRVGAFAFNKYTGTISDQLTQSNQQWDYQNPSHSSFSSANSSAVSTVSAFSSIEADAFSNLNTAMSGAGVNDFNINVISTPLATVSAMINQTYNILPDLVKWLILAILVIGIFAVIISANNYVNKD